MKFSIYAFRRLSDSIYDTAEFLTPQYKIYYGWQHLMRRIKGINQLEQIDVLMNVSYQMEKTDLSCLI